MELNKEIFVTVGSSVTETGDPERRLGDLKRKIKSEGDEKCTSKK